MYLRTLLAAAGFGLASVGNAAIMQLTGPGDIATTFLNDFETAKNLGPATFDGEASLDLASTWSGSATPSGINGLVEFLGDAPLTAMLSVKYNSVGMFFGNDDFGLTFDAILTVFDGVTNLGSVMVAANRNDFADQFIGLSSTIAFDRVEITYQRPQAQQLAVYIDDFRLGAPAAVVPEPASLALLGLGLVGMVALRRRSKKA